MLQNNLHPSLRVGDAEGGVRGKYGACGK
jgi:hypothetical protein